MSSLRNWLVVITAGLFLLLDKELIQEYMQYVSEHLMSSLQSIVKIKSVSNRANF